MRAGRILGDIERSGGEMFGLRSGSRMSFDGFEGYSECWIGQNFSMHQGGFIGCLDLEEFHTPLRWSFSFDPVRPH